MPYTWTPSIPFVTGVYPNQNIPSNDINNLIHNANIYQAKPRLSNISLTTPSINQATSGTWTATGAVVADSLLSTADIQIGVPHLLFFDAMVAVSAAVANKVIFAWFDNGVQFGGITWKIQAITTTSPIKISIIKWYIPTSQSIDLRWQIESAAPNVIATMTQGYKISALQI